MRRYLLAMIAIIGATPALGAPVTRVTELPDLVEKVLPSVVNISSNSVINFEVGGWGPFLEFWGLPKTRKHSSLGSGFIIDGNGFLLTNHHVIEQADEVLVILKNKKQYESRLIGSDAKLDLALLQMVDKKGRTPKGLVPVKMGDSAKVRIAEPVFAIGNPFGLQHTVTTGIISAKNRTIGVGPFDDFLQTDAEINPGNSGGPLFDYNGNVIGMNTAIYSNTGQSAGAGFATPINAIKEALSLLKRYGRIPRPWLGILVETVDERLARYYKFRAKKGVLVYNLVKGGPAHRAGLRHFDVITKVNGQVVEDPDAVERLLARAGIKKDVKLEIVRKSRRFPVKLKLEELPRRLGDLPKGII